MSGNKVDSIIVINRKRGNKRMPTVSELRRKLGWSQTDLAIKAGVSTGTIGRIERNGEVLRSTLILVAQALQVQPEHITGIKVVNRVRSSK